MKTPKVVLDGEQLATAAALYVRDYMGIKMTHHETKIKYQKLFDGSFKFLAEVQPL